MKHLFLLIFIVCFCINAQYVAASDFQISDSLSKDKPCIFFSLEVSNNVQNLFLEKARGFWIESETRYVVPRNNRRPISVGMCVGYNGFYKGNFPGVVDYNNEGFYLKPYLGFQIGGNAFPVWLSVGQTVFFYKEFGTLGKFRGNVFNDYDIPLHQNGMGVALNIDFCVYLKVYKNFFVQPLLGIAVYKYFVNGLGSNISVDSKSYFIPGIGYTTFISHAFKAQISLVYKLDLNPKKRK